MNTPQPPTTAPSCRPNNCKKVAHVSHLYDGAERSFAHLTAAACPSVLHTASYRRPYSSSTSSSSVQLLRSAVTDSALVAVLHSSLSCMRTCASLSAVPSQSASRVGDVGSGPAHSCTPRQAAADAVAGRAGPLHHQNTLLTCIFPAHLIKPKL